MAAAAQVDVDTVMDGLAQTSLSSASASATASSLEHPYSLHGRVVIARVLAQGRAIVGQPIVAGGWVKTGRVQGKGAFAFLEVNDGSTPKNLQCMVHSDVYDIKELTPTGTCVLLRGVLEATPESASTPVELKVQEVLFVGPCDPAEYPVAKTKLSLEFLRSVIHLRTRTNTIAALTRIRNSLAASTHRFFQERGFYYCHTPLITASDCEGAGEMFQVTTLLSTAEKLHATPMPTDEDIARADELIEKQSAKIAKMQEENVKGSKIKKEQKSLDELREKRKELTLRLASVGGLPRDASGKLDYSKDFFGKPSFLTVSGQLEAEIYACALTNVYTFGPTFRAENSFTTRHLAEFWMIEPEIAFCDLPALMRCAEDYVQFCCKAVLDECMDDMLFLSEHYDKTCIERTRNVAEKPFTRLTYTEAIDILMDHIKKGKKFEFDVEWGIDLSSEHERFLAEVVFKGPIIVYNYPTAIKAFYMRVNDADQHGRSTVAAMDILVPGVGELIGGSQREERYDQLRQRIIDGKLEVESYSWYLDLRKFGTVPHAGFGLGFERLMLFTTGMENIRDVIPFPRWPQHVL